MTDYTPSPARLAELAALHEAHHEADAKKAGRVSGEEAIFGPAPSSVNREALVAIIRAALPPEAAAARRALTDLLATEEPHA